MELKPKIDADYDDREIEFVNTRKEMLSDFTEREREIYFAGVGEGFEGGKKLALIIIVIFVLTFLAIYLIYVAVNN